MFIRLLKRYSKKRKALKIPCFQCLKALERRLERPIFRLGGGCTIHCATPTYMKILLIGRKFNHYFVDISV